MRSRPIALALGLSVLAFSLSGQAQGHRRLNPMIALHEKGLPVFGITHPAIAIGGRGRPAAPGASMNAHAFISKVPIIHRSRRHRAHRRTTERRTRRRHAAGSGERGRSADGAGGDALQGQGRRPSG